jgi:hypothetical protein
MHPPIKKMRERDSKKKKRKEKRGGKETEKSDAYASHV